MKTVNVNYPHPVLSGTNEDYVDCVFTIEIPELVSEEGDLVKIDISYTLSSMGLKKMIEDEQAKVVVYLESVETEYRKIYKFEKDQMNISVELNKGDLSNYVEIKGFIVSSVDVNNFTLPEHNKELFVAGPSKIRKGDILAVADQTYKVPLESYDPLSDRRSIFSIRQNTEQLEDIKVDITTYDKITIMLNTELFTKYRQLNEAPETRTHLSSIFAIPVLVDVLSFIKNSNNDMLDDIQDKKWYQVIITRLKELQINIEYEESMTEIASKVLPHVFKDTLSSFENVFNELMRGGE